MRKLFDINSPFGQGLAVLTDLVAVNLLFVLCCIPVVTIGASLTAMAKVTQGIVLAEGSGVVKTFFRSFKENFKQSTIFWLICMVFGALLVVDLLFVDNTLTGTAQRVGFCIWVLPVVLYFGITTWLFPMIARYENTMKGHFKNSFALLVAKLPRTILLAVLNVSPILLVLVYPYGALQTSVIWLLFGFGMLAYINALLQKPVFSLLEKDALPEE